MNFNVYRDMNFNELTNILARILTLITELAILFSQ